MAAPRQRQAARGGAQPLAGGRCAGGGDAREHDGIQQLEQARAAIALAAQHIAAWEDSLASSARGEEHADTERRAVDLVASLVRPIRQCPRPSGASASSPHASPWDVHSVPRRGGVVKALRVVRRSERHNTSRLIGSVRDARLRCVVGAPGSGWGSPAHSTHSAERCTTAY